ncbi:MAG: hypothetical protein U5K81_13810 [Trueperaceae bacterium]|nr:hypothetical protein [Trueperaceae bacterium]
MVSFITSTTNSGTDATGGSGSVASGGRLRFDDRGVTILALNERLHEAA